MRPSIEALRYRKDWREEYKSKLVSAEEAVKSGDFVVTPLPNQPSILQEALAARAAELRNVTISASAPALKP